MRPKEYLEYGRREEFSLLEIVYLWSEETGDDMAAVFKILIDLLETNSKNQDTYVRIWAEAGRTPSRNDTTEKAESVLIAYFRELLKEGITVENVKKDHLIHKLYLRRKHLIKLMKQAHLDIPSFLQSDESIAAPASIGTLFPTPKDTKWDQIAVRVTDGDAVLVQTRNISKKYACTELGFKDSRKGNTPDEIWGTFRVLARCNGELDFQDHKNPDDKDKYQKHISIIRKRLKNFMQIDDDPFFPYQKYHAYKTKFLLSYPDSPLE